jgi:hypothetical protein
MDRMAIIHNWDRWKEHIKQQYPDVTDEDLIYELEKEEEVFERLEKKTGKTKEEIYNWLHMMG